MRYTPFRENYDYNAAIFFFILGYDNICICFIKEILIHLYKIYLISNACIIIFYISFLSLSAS